MVNTANNGLPDAANDTYTLNEDSLLAVLAANGLLSNDSDPEGSTLTAALAAGPANGTATVNTDGSFTYTPHANFIGTDTFTYTVNDGNGGQSTATATLTVAPVTDLTATDDTLTVDEDSTNSPGSVATNDSTTSGGTLSYALATDVNDGTLNFNTDGTYTYTPDANFNGSDSFTYTVTDVASGESLTQTVVITVTSVDDAPAAVANSLNTDEDVALSGNVSTNDTPSGDGGNTYSIEPGDGPANGTVNLNPDGTFTYTPDANFNGTDSFTYTLTDADGDAVTATATITVTSINDLPIATADQFITDENNVVTGDVSANDTPSGDGGNTYFVEAGDGPGSGSLTLNSDGTFTYVATNSSPAADAFTYTLVDANGDTVSARVDLQIANVTPSSVFAAASEDFEQTRAAINEQSPPFAVTVASSPSQATSQTPAATYLPPPTAFTPDSANTLYEGVPTAFQWATADGRSPFASQNTKDRPEGPQSSTQDTKPQSTAKQSLLAVGGRLQFTEDNGNAIRLPSEGDPQEIIQVTLRAEHGILTLGNHEGIALESAAGQDPDGQPSSKQDGTSAGAITVTGPRQVVKKALEGLIYRTATTQQDTLTIEIANTESDGPSEALSNDHAIEIVPVDIPTSTPPTDLAEVETDQGRFGAGLIGAGLLGWMLCKRHTSPKPSQRDRKDAA